MAITLSLAFLALLFITIMGNGYSAFQQTDISSSTFFSIRRNSKRNWWRMPTFRASSKTSLRGLFPDVRERRDKRSLYGLVSPGAAFQVRSMVLDDPESYRQKIRLGPGR